MEVLENVDEGLTQLYSLGQERTKDMERVSTFQPERMNDGLRGQKIKVEGGLEYQALDSV